jgi:hypothetical protein
MSLSSTLLSDTQSSAHMREIQKTLSTFASNFFAHTFDFFIPLVLYYYNNYYTLCVTLVAIFFCIFIPSKLQYVECRQKENR